MNLNQNNLSSPKGTVRQKKVMDLLNKTTSQEEVDAVVRANSPDGTTGRLGRFSSISDRSLNVGPQGEDFHGAIPKDEFVGPINKSKGRGFKKGLMDQIDGFQSFALRSEEFLSDEFKARNGLARTINYMNPFNESVKTDVMNSFGMLTKNQKIQESVNKAFFNRVMTTGFAGYFAFDAVMNDENPITSIASTTAAFAVAGGAMTIGRGIGGTIGTAVSRLPAYGSAITKAVTGKSSNAFQVGKWGKRARLAGATTGAVAGLAAGVGAIAMSGVMEGLQSMVDSDGYYNKLASDIHRAGQYASNFQSQDTLTMRQQALAKMSKSGLNDRAMMLGNEALVMRGIL